MNTSPSSNASSSSSSSSKREESLIKIRFIGDKLNQNSLPIYELGTSFIAIQRIINKTYLFKNERLHKGAHLPWEDREILSLQISEHTKESDGFGFIPFSSDPFIIGLFSGLVVEAFTAMARYVTKKVLPNKKEGIPENHPLVGAIYNDIKSLTDRIDNVGGTQNIQFTTIQNLNIGTINLDAGTRDYTRAIKEEPFLGEVTEISGVVTRMYPQSKRIDVRINPNHYVKVRLEDKDFDMIRYSESKELSIKIKGRPIYHLGIETKKFDEFEAKKVMILNSE